ncbi:hypothetical protein QAD02_000525 [Eretmocerus hayati]|uniref:Uncharacterized protein n=1 Tax=Eretmocerus hayati TaxID=131215 RepID=A0ACC2NF51_9HYME|nr:hypothetical protein QAD02_000525 [Eretmocerus hayati]
MPTSCAVPGYPPQSKVERRSFFKVPRDDDERQRWATNIGKEGSPEVEEASLGPHGPIEGEIGAGRTTAASAPQKASGQNLQEGKALGQKRATPLRQNAESRRCEETSSDLLQNGVCSQEEGNSIFGAAATEV